MIQIYVAIFIALQSSSLLYLKRQFVDCLIDLSALLIVNEIDNIFGKFFMMHLKTFHEDVISRENFLKFESTKKHKQVAYYYCMGYLFFMYFHDNLSFYLNKCYNCLDFDQFYETYYILKQYYKPNAFYQTVGWIWYVMK